MKPLRHACDVRPGKAAGFTLVELLVVIAIVGVLMALLLPAIQSAREAGRRTACINHLKQLGIAQQGFHDAHGRFPPGRGGPPPKIFSPQAYLLPYVEEGSIEQQIYFDLAPTPVVIAGMFYSGAENKPAASTPVPVLQCPSDVTVGRVPGSDYAATNYVACSGSGTVNEGSLTAADGVFFKESKITFKNLLDGSSHTAAFSERMLGTGQPATTLAPELSASYILELKSSSPVSPANCQVESNGLWYKERGAKWILGNYGNTVYNHYHVPNAVAWDCMNLPQQQGYLSARSYHLGGVNVLFCDGSVRFVTDEIALEVWRAWGTREGSEALDAL
jgi:prepilin-type N-terminal cleavage/methylation domain-containing protein/prepilin-type processing-associated H-X9-DG protein